MQLKLLKLKVLRLLLKHYNLFQTCWLCCKTVKEGGGSLFFMPLSYMDALSMIGMFGMFGMIDVIVLLNLSF